MRIHLNVRIFHFVTLEVDFEIAFGGETIAAHVALERTLAGVRTDVDLQGAVAAEDFAAIATSVLEEGVFAVPTVMARLGIVTATGSAFAVLGRAVAKL